MQQKENNRISPHEGGNRSAGAHSKKSWPTAEWKWDSEQPLQNSRLGDGGASGRLPPSRFTHKPIPRCHTFLIMELRQSFSKALADDIRMHSQATSCVIIYASANQLRFHTHFFNSLKNEKHDYKLHPWYREIAPHYLSLWQIYNKIPAVSMSLKIHVIGFSSSFKI